MSPNLLQCACCKISIIFDMRDIQRVFGDWIIHCESCGAENILAVVIIGNVPVPTLEPVGYRGGE